MNTTKSTRIVVMTGASSGFGANALRHVTAQPDTQVIIGARGASPEGVEGLPLDLSSPKVCAALLLL